MFEGVLRCGQRETAMRLIASLLALLALATPLAAQPAEPPIVAEARAFMASYAEAMIAGDRAGIAARYDRTGSRFLGHGINDLRTLQQIAAIYDGPDWQPPQRFAWRDLAYEPAGPEAVIVSGLFDWTPANGGTPLTFSYTALLRRQDGALRIRLEHESRGARGP